VAGLLYQLLTCIIRVHMLSLGECTDVLCWLWHLPLKKVIGLLLSSCLVDMMPASSQQVE